jgi:hypothetical protein
MDFSEGLFGNIAARRCLSRETVGCLRWKS